jgi:4,5-dihydroxyphthalate decarboxylase
VSRLRLSFACWDYDRTRALFDGSIQPDGIDLNCLNLPVEETFFRMIRNGEFDDLVLSNAERRCEMAVCVSRAHSDELPLEL